MKRLRQQPAVAVITATAGEPQDWIQKCNSSVNNQTISCAHIIVCDGPCREDVVDLRADLIQLEHRHYDCGDAARAHGLASALSRGFKAAAFLDADNWFAPSHVEGLIAAACKVGAPVAASRRWLCDIDGNVMGLCTQSGSADFSDTSSVFLTADAFEFWIQLAHLPSWAHAIGDRIAWRKARLAGTTMGFTGEPTSYYRCKHASFYTRLGYALPPLVAPRSDGAISRAVTRWHELTGQNLRITNAHLES